MTSTDSSLDEIFWDPFGIGGHSGVGRHSQQLYQSLIKIGVTPKILQRPDKGILNNPVVRSKLVWTAVISRSHQIKSYRGNRAIFHGLSNFNIPISKSFHRRFRTVLTLHDLIPVIVPKLVSRASSLQLQYYIKSLESSVDRVICVSNWSKNELLERFPGYQGRVEVIPNGYIPLRINAMSPAPIERAQKIILSVSRFEKYKNFDTLLSIIKRLPPCFSLVLVTDHSGRRFMENQGSDQILSGRLIIRSGLTDDQLTHLYKSSDIYLQASKYEGFCLPLVEALSHGIPCLFMEGSGMDEIAPEPFCTRLKRSAKTEDWIAAVEAVEHRKFSPGFAGKLGEFLDSRHSWHQVAIRTAKVYAKIL